MTTPNPTRRTTYCKSVGQPFRAPARVSCGLGGLGMDYLAIIHDYQCMWALLGLGFTVC